MFGSLRNIDAYTKKFGRDVISVTNEMNESTFVTWKDFNVFCKSIFNDIATLRAWQKIVVFLLTSNFLMNTYLIFIHLKP